MMNVSGFGAWGANPNMGLPNYGAVVLPALQANGMVTLNGTTVTGEAQLNGNLTLTNANLGALTGNGFTTLNGTTVQGLTRINGLVNAINSVFQNTLRIASNRVDLTGCQTRDIVIADSGNPNPDAQTLVLTQTTVNGSIHFETGRGVLIRDNASQVTGPITGLAQPQ